MSTTIETVTVPSDAGHDDNPNCCCSCAWCQWMWGVCLTCNTEA